MAAIHDLAYLQGLVKSDPHMYKDEAMKQYQQFLTQYEIFQLKPTKEHKEFSSFIKFLSQVAPCYPTELKTFPPQIAELLENSAQILEPKLRETLVRALVLLRNRNLLSPTSLLPLFFKLFRIQDKPLRQILRTHIVSDICKSNAHKRNNELNRTLQNFMYGMLKDSSSQACRESLGVMIELWRRNVWTDGKTVNVISTGIFHKDPKVIAQTLQFFLSADHRYTDENKEDLPTKAAIVKKYGALHSRKTKKRKHKLEAKLSDLKKKKTNELKNETVDEKQYNYAAMTSINDPQTYCEKVFNIMKSSPHGFDLRIQLMSFISRLITANLLMVDGFYSYMQKYAQPHTQNITQILAILAQSSHHLVSPDVLEPILQHIANSFVTDRRPVEVIAIGLNTIREICARAPLIMNPTLLKDLCQYKRHKDKGIMMASKSLIALFRAINPAILPRRERGKDADLTIKPREFGETVVMTGIDGADLLAQYESDGDSWSAVDGESDEEMPEARPTNQVSESGSDSWEEVSVDDEEGAPQLVPMDGDEEEESDSEELVYDGSIGSGSDEEEEGSSDEEGVFESGEEAGSGDFFEIDSDEFEEGSGSDEVEGEEDEEMTITPVKSSKKRKAQGDTEESGSATPTPKKRTKRVLSTVDQGGYASGEASEASTSTARRERLETARILTDEDFEKIRALKAKREEVEAVTGKIKAQLKRKRDMMEMMGEELGDVSESDLVAAKKRQRTTYEERVTEILQNKEDKKGYSKYRKERKLHSTTNEEKAKGSKPFAMVKHKEVYKSKLSQKQKKLRETKHRKKQKSQSMNRHF